MRKTSRMVLNTSLFLRPELSSEISRFCLQRIAPGWHPTKDMTRYVSTFAITRLITAFQVKGRAYGGGPLEYVVYDENAVRPAYLIMVKV